MQLGLLVGRQGGAEVSELDDCLRSTGETQTQDTDPELE